MWGQRGGSGPQPPRGSRVGYSNSSKSLVISNTGTSLLSCWLLVIGELTGSRGLGDSPGTWSWGRAEPVWPSCSDTEGFLPRVLPTRGHLSAGWVGLLSRVEGRAVDPSFYCSMGLFWNSFLQFMTLRTLLYSQFYFLFYSQFITF